MEIKISRIVNQIKYYFWRAEFHNITILLKKEKKKSRFLSRQTGKVQIIIHPINCSKKIIIIMRLEKGSSGVYPALARHTSANHIRTANVGFDQRHEWRCRRQMSARTPPLDTIYNIFFHPRNMTAI